MARSKFNVNFDDVMDETPVDNNILENKIITPEPKDAEKVNKNTPFTSQSTHITDNDTSSKRASKENRKVSKSATKEKVEKPAASSYTKTCINIDSEKSELVKIAAMMGYKGNVSAYINALIDKDIKTNGESYKKIMNLINK